MYKKTEAKVNLVRIYCTNPQCEPQCENPEREFNETEFKQTFLDDNSRKQRFCEYCGMSTILQNRYLPLRKIGEGGFGKAFYARDLNLQQYCVVKILHPQKRFQSSKLQSVIKGFQEGANILRNLKHLQIPTIYDYFNLPAPDQQETLFYLVQEYIPGKTLAQELNQQGKYSEAEVDDIFRSLLEIISYTHKEDVFHRDIKPSNIIRHDQNGKLYLIDFDTAIKRELEPGVPVAQSLVMGTPGYAPPEQLAGREIDASADLYAIAATCVNFLTGRDIGEIIQISRSSQLRRTWREYAPNVSEYFANILDNMLSHQRKERYQSAQEVIDILLSRSSFDKKPDNGRNTEPSPLINGDTEPSPLINEDTEPPQPPKKKSRWKLPVVLAVLAMIMTLAIHYFFFRPCLKYSCDTGDSFSWGEEILIKSKTSQDKQKGTKAFQDGDYESAIKNFQEHLKNNPNDPEALIYLNNAIAALTKNPVKIAASVPINLNKDSSLSEETLRGIAHAQSKYYNFGFDIVKADIVKAIQENKNPRLLQVQIADESKENKSTSKENEKRVEDVANRFFKDESIIGVIGHPSSEYAAIAAKVYKEKLVLISPDSTVVRDNRNGVNLNYNYLFRTSSTDYTAASDLINYINDNKNNPQKKELKIAMIGDETPYSRSFRDLFKDILENKESIRIGTVTNECEISSETPNCSNLKNKNIKLFITEEKNSGADVILLALDFETSKGAVKDIFDTSIGDMKIFGSDGVYNFSLLKNLDERKITLQKEQIVIAIPWHRSKEKNEKSSFEEEAEKLWGGRVNWRTAMAYNATRSITNVLEKLNTSNTTEEITRQRLYYYLTKVFTADGAEKGTRIEFCKNGDRKLQKGIGVLVEVIQTNDGSGQKSEFSLLEKPERTEECPSEN